VSSPRIRSRRALYRQLPAAGHPDLGSDRASRRQAEAQVTGEVMGEVAGEVRRLLEFLVAGMGMPGVTKQSWSGRGSTTRTARARRRRGEASGDT
jgi:hypothetical protein